MVVVFLAVWLIGRHIVTGTLSADWAIPSAAIAIAALKPAQPLQAERSDAPVSLAHQTMIISRVRFE